MADWEDWLEGISGGFLGVTKGLTEGLKPFDAWEKVRTQDLANDKSDVLLRDLYGVQDAREALPGYYGNVVGYADTNNRLGMAKGERDIFGVNQALAGSRYMANPNDAFQQMVQALGLTPADPEYRRLAAEARSYFDPEGAIAATDKYNIPGMQQRNLNLQAVGRYIESQAQRVDPGAFLVWMEDGTAVVVGSDGETKMIEPTMMVRAASMMAQKDPYTAVSTGIKDEIGINASNANMYNTLNNKGANNVTSAQQVKLLNDRRIGLTNLYNSALNEVRNIMGTQEYKLATPEQQQQMVAVPKARAVELRTQIINTIQQQQQLGTTGMMPGGGRLPAGGVRPQGAPSVTTNRRPVGDVVNRAAGAGGGAPWGTSSAGGGPYPTPGARQMPSQELGGTMPGSYEDLFGGGGEQPAYDTGIQPISNLNLEQFIQQLLQGQ